MVLPARLQASHYLGWRRGAASIALCRAPPLLTRIRPGTVRLKIPDREEYELVYVSGGVLEVQPTLITLLADTAIRAHDLDEAKSIEAKRRAEEALKNREADVSYASAEAELAQAVAQLATIKRVRGRH